MTLRIESLTQPAFGIHLYQEDKPRKQIVSFVNIRLNESAWKEFTLLILIRIFVLNNFI